MSHLSITCPHCKSNLPVRYMPAAGTQVQCPKCRAAFAIQPPKPTVAPGDLLGASSVAVVPSAPVPAAPVQATLVPPKPVARPATTPAAGAPYAPIVPPALQPPPAAQTGYSQPSYGQPGYGQAPYAAAPAPLQVPAAYGVPAGSYAPVAPQGYDPLQKPALAPPATAPGSKTGLIIAAIAGCAVLGIVLITVVVVSSMGGKKDPALAASGTSSPYGATSGYQPAPTPGVGGAVPSPFTSGIPAPNGSTPVPPQPVPGIPAPIPTVSATAPPPPPPVGTTASGIVPGAGPVAKGLATVSTEPASAYRFEPGKMAHYTFSIDAPAQGAKSFGAIYFRTDELAQAEIERKARSVDEVTGTGTAFVVHRDGLLVTCAHVVEGAKSIEVKFGTESYVGELVAIDSVRDLAVLRIDARNLTELPMGDSSTLELAEEVRAVGFPLASQLGESIKITRGTLSGRVSEPSGELLQIDAPINPGNSGGPLVDEKGNFVGVCSSGLVGEQISNVGFACPSADVMKMLNKLNVSLVSTLRTDSLTGPRLARLVTPSVALVKVKSSDASGAQAIEYSGYLADQTRIGPGLRREETSKLILSHAGEVLASKGSLELPHHHGLLGNLIFQQLGTRGERKWDTRRVTTVTVTQSRSVFPPGFPGGMPGGFGPRGIPGGSSQIVLPALERSSYELVTEGDELKVKKEYAFVVLGGDMNAEEPDPMLGVSGSGEFIFDTKQGLPKLMTFDTQVMTKLGSGPPQYPTKLTWQLKEVVPTSTGNLPTQPQPDLASSTTPSAPVPAPVPFPAVPNIPSPAPPPDFGATRPAEAPTAKRETDPKKVDEIIVALESADDSFAAKFLPVSQLSMMEPIDSKRDKVATLLDRLLTTKQQSVRSAAIRAVAKWGTQRNIPTLMRLCDELDLGTRWGAINALGDIGGDAESAAKVATLMGDQNDMLTAANALKKMGTFAEEPVWKHLQPDNVQLFLQATHVLDEVGTARSITALEPFVNHEHISVRSSATRLVAKLKERAGIK